MGRILEEDAVLNEIGKWIGYLDEDMICRIKIGIKRLPMAQRWIPCSERLPEENQICIVTDETMRDTYEYRFCKETYDENQGWTYLRHRIIAWMPLPEPYRGEPCATE